MAVLDEQIEVLESVIKKYKDDPQRARMVDITVRKLSQLKGKKQPAKAKKKPDGDCPQAITDALSSISEALELIEKGRAGDVIDSTRKVELTPVEGIKVELEGPLPPIFYIALSDLQSSNNVYLYGGAGTGKTYNSEQLAKALNCTLVTINCNQYTSPLEIIGGQTIDGYQEGKLITAWANLTSEAEGVAGGMEAGTSGCLLLLDELPKIDPNTAGLLNDALAKVKDKGKVQNARGVSFKMENFYCIATGNSKLNEENVDYVANFRQDLSLQDRFAGSVYEVFVDPKVAKNQLKNFLFIFIYLSKVNELIRSKEGKAKNMESKAFVSIRIMQSLRDSWMYWYKNEKKEPKVKTIIDGVRSFFGLFTPQQAEWLKTESDLNGFREIVEGMKKRDMGTNTKQQESEAQNIIEAWEESMKGKL